MAIGIARLSSVDFNGLIRVDDTSSDDDDFVGFVFSFQDSSHFYLVYSSRDQSQGTASQGPWKIVRVTSTNPGGLKSGVKTIRNHKLKYISLGAFQFLTT